MQASARACRTDCSASPILNFPNNDRTKNLASECLQRRKINWILSPFFPSDFKRKFALACEF